ncbi:exo-alpha-sialidase [Membranihabitans marinus]|uniref:exo-alpha-sialidase n=1 Tax=Membranihabitans marinus TaxID=1227546 RepID=UPI001F18BA14|nr:exo-alpha-sialidase [Membranihabitans marinus]
MKSRNYLFIIFSLLVIVHPVIGQESYPHPETNPSSPLMLQGPGIPEETHDLDFENLPVIASTHSIVNDVRYAWGRKVNQHNYLVHYKGLYWAMWSDGVGNPRDGVGAEKHRGVVPGHDLPGQLVSFATSKDGIHWSEPRSLAGDPKTGHGWIARGFWVRDGKLLALVTQYGGRGYRGKGLQLHAFELTSKRKMKWEHLGMVMDDAMNNFSPKKLPTGEWMMTRRDSMANVHIIIGGVKSFDQWENFPLIGYKGKELAAEEPYWLILPDNNLVAFFRDNNRSGYLYRAFSTDNGKTWSNPVKTNFPDARSKFSGLRLKDGRYILVSNSNPEKRDPMTIAVSEDGLVFNKIGYLVGGRHIDYPHVIEHNGEILVAFAGAKQTMEVLKFPVSALDKL